jgi:hypothetical protein
MGRSEYLCDESGEMVADERRAHVHKNEDIARYF